MTQQTPTNTNKLLSCHFLGKKHISMICLPYDYNQAGVYFAAKCSPFPEKPLNKTSPIHSEPISGSSPIHRNLQQTNPSGFHHRSNGNPYFTNGEALGCDHWDFEVHPPGTNTETAEALVFERQTKQYIYNRNTLIQKIYIHLLFKYFGCEHLMSLWHWYFFAQTVPQCCTPFGWTHEQGSSDSTMHCSSLTVYLEIPWGCTKNFRNFQFLGTHKTAGNMKVCRTLKATHDMQEDQVQIKTGLTDQQPDSIPSCTLCYSSLLSDIWVQYLRCGRGARLVVVHWRAHLRCLDGSGKNTPVVDIPIHIPCIPM